MCIVTGAALVALVETRVKDWDRCDAPTLALLKLVLYSVLELAAGAACVVR